VGGRKAFPPKADKNLIERINKKERRKAIRSAISGSKYMILDDSFEKLNKSKDVINSLLKNDLKSELERLENKKIRAGRGTTRGRKYITKKGPLVIVSDMCPAVLATENLQGFDVSVVNNLNAELLAPGGNIGRRTIWTKSAVEKLEKEKLFL
jgi:large subunit ribosomal protein L4e